MIFIHEFLNTISRKSESLSKWAVWYQKRVNKNDIRFLTCNNLFITYYMLKKKSSHLDEVQESIDKTAQQFFPTNLTPGIS